MGFERGSRIILTLEQQESPMADEIAKQKITVKNTGKAPNVLIDASGVERAVGPGQELEVEVAQPHAKALQEQSKAGSTLHVKGSEPEKEQEPEGAPQIPDEQTERGKMAAKETELMKAGYDADKDGREKRSKKNWPKLGAEMGVGIVARAGPDALETVTAPPDAPPEKN
jgi:hypothetical protein